MCGESRPNTYNCAESLFDQEGVLRRNQSGLVLFPAIALLALVARLTVLTAAVRRYNSRSRRIS